jgi:hypothetical protein
VTSLALLVLQKAIPVESPPLLLFSSLVWHYSYILWLDFSWFSSCRLWILYVSIFSKVCLK